ncbi:DUF2207 domain-containing protein [Leucobacter luti]|uniref:Putative membrane protein DUF2207 n=1 Tax=Leucobacter luti TaxID=340320 RepID=A0A4Q7TPJ3_9MICO|nr:DUF2207 domain-containing protein [Leucobacter luti]MBL3699973.1 DUF2207 domain-containing protein [Leucobacter luti]RZT62711.1 putative membrane protein DUF2207 [Leucobacter luti]
MSKDARPARRGLPGPDFFDLAGSDPELLNSGRIPDPVPAHTPLFRWLARILTAVEARLRARGDASARTALRFLWALLGAVGLFLLFGPIINKPHDFDAVIAAAEVDEVDWVARDVSVDYAVTRGADGGFAAEIAERYTADFRNGPEPSVERVLVTEFQGHDAEFELGEVLVDGTPATAELVRAATTTTIRITPPTGTEFAGTHNIAVSYELHHLITAEVDDATGQPVDALNWPVFGQLWPQATRGIEVSLTLPAELDAALIRQPQAYVGWLIASATEWLEPEAVGAGDGEGAGDGVGADESAGSGDAADVRYSFTNDQGLPPYPDIVIRASFEPGTFAQPPTTALFWWQSYGPLLPLVVLAALALFAAAARRVVWADSAGEPWYLARSEPPEGLSPELAAALLGKTGHAELVAELAAPPTKRAPREPWLARLARAGRRAGRWGNLPAVRAAARRWRAPDEAVERGLRWVPDSYVRDFFVFAPIAITLLQWGVLRQLSEQVILTVVWWPAAFVVASTALALATLVLVHRPRPLTRRGALAVQQLKGAHVFARATRLTERGPLDDPLLPFALLFERPRRAGQRVAALAIREAGSPAIAAGWRGDRFLSLPGMLSFAAALAVLAGAIVTVATVPPPYEPTTHFSEDASNLPGTLAVEVSGFDVRAELSRDASGAARLAVTEQLDVVFAADSARVPQVAREWRTSYLGQDLGFALDSFSIDGAEVPVRELPQPRSAVAVTQLTEALSGAHEVEVRYTLASAAVDAGPTAAAEQVRWAAWLDTWDDEYYTNPNNPYDGSAPVRPLRIELTVAPDLAAELRGGGWIDSDRELPQIPDADGNTVVPWVAEMATYDDAGQRRELRVGSETVREDGALVVTFDADAVESREVDVLGEGGEFEVSPEVNATLGSYELQIGGFTDLGARLDFAPGTFAGVEAGAAQRAAAEYDLPFAAMMWFTGALLAACVGTAVAALLRRRPPSLGLGLIAFGALPVLLIAQCVVFWWVVGPMPSGNARGVAAFILAGAMLVAFGAQLVAVVRRHGRTGGE